MTSTETITQLLPELILVLAGTAVYLAGAFLPNRAQPTFFSYLGLLAAFGVMLYGQADLKDYPKTVSGPIAIDLFGETARMFIVLAGALLISSTRKAEGTIERSEAAGSLLMLLAGLMICARANDLVLVFVGLELVSIPTYVLLALGKRGAATQEATTKYFYLSILSSGLLLYGFSFLYGASGSTDLAEIGGALRATPVATAGVDAQANGAGLNDGIRKLAGIGMLFVIAGLGFRLTAVPFHFYAPDVYQGAGHANAGLLSTMPKVAGLVVLTRVVAVAMPGVDHLSWKVVLAISLVTMTLGNILALWQNDLHRMLAYSSVAHGGYLLIGVAVGLYQRSQGTSTGVDGIGSSLFYVAVYTFATVGIFAIFSTLGTDEKSVETVDDLGGLVTVRPVAAIALSVFLFSLAGIPPFAGFWGKFNLFLGAVQIGGGTETIRANGSILTEPANPWFLALAIAGALNAAIAAAYYLRLIAKMCFGPATGTPLDNPNQGPKLAAIVCVLLVIGAGIFPGLMQTQAQNAGKGIYSYADAKADPVKSGEPVKTPEPAKAAATIAPTQASVDETAAVAR
ncbi:MAG: NADH-quinone oxidoreductase subunit N [Pirellulales bacterium]